MRSGKSKDISGEMGGLILAGYIGGGTIMYIGGGGNGAGKVGGGGTGRGKAISGAGAGEGYNSIRWCL